MHKFQHAKNTVRYYILIVFLLAFLFVSNDFGLIDVQKTAIIMAAGIDREEDTFIVTSQVAVPQSGGQNPSTKAVQIVSRGKTIADAFDEINAKTGWYPKLVFCNLLLLGSKAAEENVFDALEFFLRDEYLTDNCFVAVCDGFAKDLLNVSALVDSASSLAITKVLSSHAKRIGTVLPSTLREFSIGYFGDGSGFLPLLSKQAQQEKIGNSSSSPSQNNGSASDSSGNSSGSSTNQNSGQAGGEMPQNQPVFSAQETALFVEGKKRETLTPQETFSVSAVMNKLQLAPYTVISSDGYCTLTIKDNAPKIRLSLENGIPVLKIRITFAAGIRDYSKAQELLEISDAGDVPTGVFALAKKQMESDIFSAFEKSRGVNCDLFGIKSLLEKYENKYYKKLKDAILQTVRLDVDVSFRNVR